MENYTPECRKDGATSHLPKAGHRPCAKRKAGVSLHSGPKRAQDWTGETVGAPKLCLSLCSTPASRPWLLRQSPQFPQLPPWALDGPTGPGETLPQA